MNQNMMATREQIFQRLSTVRTQELLNLLSDEAIFHLASRYFESTSDANYLAPVDNATATFAVEQTKKVPSDRAKRPLNAFMAFRSTLVCSIRR